MKVFMDEQKTCYAVSGFVFYDEETAGKAEKEVTAVAYTRDRLDMNNPDAVLSVYNRIVRERMFVTPVGYEYLKELLSYLEKAPNIKAADISKLDFTPDIIREEDLIKEAVPDDTVGSTEEKKRPKKLRKYTEKKKSVVGEDVERLRGGLVTSLIVNAILVLAIIAMFVLVSKSDVPTIIDYENKLIDRYEEWQKSLEEREATIREYEEKYNINNGFTAQ
ncbi:MAG: hypothetical protein IJT81_08935 [Lachnospiraceae bacterium]|nr:hypothetical protein [Lachnospiraceae bacterium]